MPCARGADAEVAPCWETEAETRVDAEVDPHGETEAEVGGRGGGPSRGNRSGNLFPSTSGRVLLSKGRYPVAARLLRIS